MKADNQMKKDHQIEPRSEYGNLPPELKATQKVMDAMFGGYPVFGALNAGSTKPASKEAALADRLEAMLHQVGHPDYSLKEFYEGIKLIVWELRNEK